MPLMNRTIAIAQVNLTACFSAAVLGAGSRSAERSECKRWRNAGQDGEERYKLIYRSFSKPPRTCIWVTCNSL